LSKLGNHTAASLGYRCEAAKAVANGTHETKKHLVKQTL